MPPHLFTPAHTLFASPTTIPQPTTPAQVANILTVDLPDEEHGHTPGPAADDDELDTPLALRFVKSSAERAAPWGSGGSGTGTGSGGRVGGVGGGLAGADRRSRLALASGPREQEADAAAEQDIIEDADSEEEQQAAMQVDAPAAAQQEPGEGEQQAPDQQQQQGQEGAAEEAAEEHVREAATAKGVAARFSVRQLVQHPERPVVVHKGTPLAGALPSSPAGSK